MYARVIVDIAHPDVDRVFDYLVPEGMELEAGCRVAVPFGRQKKEGLIVSLSETTEVPAGKLRPVLRRLDAMPALRPEDFRIAEYLAATYHTTMAQALRLLLPSRLRGGRSTIRTENFVELAVHGSEYEQAVGTLLKKDGSPRYPKQLEVLERLRLAPRGIRLADLPASSVKTLLKKKYVRMREDTVSKLLERRAAPAAPEKPRELSGEQKATLYTILHSDRQKFLLHGVTGSGKTEVYIRIIRSMLEQGRTAILLVPEISLTPQTYDYIRRRLDVDVALFHSRLTDAERYEQWLRVRRGLSPVVIGPRSAVFAPLDNLGVIILDEEHESSYKSDRYPCYTAREIAELRCTLSGAALIAGSATPSLRTYKEALEGKYTLLEMPHRLFGLPLPPVEIVDMREEYRAGNSGIISAALDEAVRGALARREQIMIMLNRRGYSSVMMCPSCGEAVQCDSCDVAMTYHKSEGMLKCHYCGARKELPAVCPGCGAARLTRLGVGTQQLEEELRHLYPQARILRMDTDTMSGRDAHLRAYEQFRDGEADILIGTQMIAKGFDFEHVTVAAILGVDAMLHMPDFRSAERTFDQITQLAGRAGRQGEGRVLVQTYSPGNYAVQAAARHDYTAFFEEESAYRRSMFLPPYGSYLLIRFQSARQEDAALAARDFLGRMRTALAGELDDIIKVRASESPIRRLKEQYRYQILVHLRSEGTPAAGTVLDLAGQARYPNVLVGVDIDPASMS
ncbi:MAG: primosomal protein N' [Clostridia bacterium]|nr:primosomal protein N' [Clostridia bacterium]